MSRAEWEKARAATFFSLRLGNVVLRSPYSPRAVQVGRRLDSASLGGRGDPKTSSIRHLPTWKVETAQSPWQAVMLRVLQQWRRPCRSSCRTVRRRTVAGPGSPCLGQSPRILPVALHKVFRSELGHSPPPGPLASVIVLVHAFPGGRIPLFSWLSWGGGNTWYLVAGVCTRPCCAQDVSVVPGPYRTWSGLTAELLPLPSS